VGSGGSGLSEVLGKQSASHRYVCQVEQPADLSQATENTSVRANRRVAGNVDAEEVLPLRSIVLQQCVVAVVDERVIADRSGSVVTELDTEVRRPGEYAEGRYGKTDRATSPRVPRVTRCRWLLRSCSSGRREEGTPPGRHVRA
jgi:hypothetical protein